jgi:hypothetical protein
MGVRWGSPWSQEVTEAKVRSQGLCGSLRPLGAIWGSSGVMKGHRGHWRQDGSGWATWGHLRSPEATEVIEFTEVTWSQTGSGEETPSTLTPLPHTHSCELRQGHGHVVYFSTPGPAHPTLTPSPRHAIAVPAPRARQPEALGPQPPLQLLVPRGPQRLCLGLVTQVATSDTF